MNKQLNSVWLRTAGPRIQVVRGPVDSVVRVQGVRCRVSGFRPLAYLLQVKLGPQDMFIGVANEPYQTDLSCAVALPDGPAVSLFIRSRRYIFEGLLNKQTNCILAPSR